MKALLFTAALVVALGLVGKADVEDATAHGSLYCEMVELYQATNGDQGWPAYDPAIDCNN